jgi:hypothetical protein
VVVKRGLDGVKLLEAVVRERLAKIRQAAKDLTNVVVICELRRLAVAL